MVPACDAWAEIRRAIAAHPQKGSFLDVGGRDGRHAALAEGFRDYTILDLEPHGLYDQIRGDICALEPDLLPDGTIDVLFSTDLLEHVTDPPAAARTIGRLLKPGGLAITQTLFAWDYHPRPVDYWRFTHAGLAYLFEQYGGLRTELAAYDAALRLEDLRGSGLLDRAGIVRRRLVKRKVLHIGRKP